MKNVLTLTKDTFLLPGKPHRFPPPGEKDLHGQ